MSTHRFSVDTRLVWNSVPFFVKKLLPGNRLELESLQDGKVITVTFTDLYKELAQGSLYFSATGSPAAPPVPASLADYSAREQEIARYRLAAIEPLLKIPNGLRTTADVKKRVDDLKAAQARGEYAEMPVSVPSLYRWLKEYGASGNDIRALLPQKRTPASQQDEVVEKIMTQVIDERYFVRERVKVDDILHEVAVRLGLENRQRREEEKLKMPSRATIWRRLNARDPKSILVAKRGRREAEMEMGQFGAMEYPKFPLERVEIDHTLTDIFVVDDDDNLPLGRLTLTYCLDVATRYPLGLYLGFEPPSYLTVSACLHHAILPKPDARELYGTEHQWLACGIPHTLVVDNGKEFIGGSLQDACLSLGILLQRLPAQTPHFKATVERMFGTFNTGLFHMLPGTTFSNVDARGDYDSVRFASLRQEEIYQMMHVFLLDIYAESFHRGLGAVPARRWEAAMQAGFFPRVPTNPEELSILLGRLTERVINHYGIEFESLRYNCHELSLLRHRLRTQANTAGSARVKIKYLPHDLGQIYVFDPFEMKYIKVPALDQAYAQGLTLWSHQIIRNQALLNQDKVSMEALGEAKRKIQAIVAASKERSKKGQARKRLARWDAANGAAPPASEASPPSWLPPIDLDKPEDGAWGIDNLEPD